MSLKRVSQQTNQSSGIDATRTQEAGSSTSNNTTQRSGSQSSLRKGSQTAAKEGLSTSEDVQSELSKGEELQVQKPHRIVKRSAPGKQQVITQDDRGIAVDFTLSYPLGIDPPPPGLGCGC